MIKCGMKYEGTMRQESLCKSELLDTISYAILAEDYFNNVEKMEHWDLYNKDKQKINKTILRGEKINAGEYFLVVNIWIINDKMEKLKEYKIWR